MVSCTLDMVVDSGSNDTRCRISTLGTDASRETADCGKLADSRFIATLGTALGWFLGADCGILPTLGCTAGYSCTGRGWMVTCLKMLASWSRASIYLSPI